MPEGRSCVTLALKTVMGLVLTQKPGVFATDKLDRGLGTALLKLVPFLIQPIPDALNQASQSITATVIHVLTIPQSVVVKLIAVLAQMMASLVLTARKVGKFSFPCLLQCNSHRSHRHDFATKAVASALQATGAHVLLAPKMNHSGPASSQMPALFLRASSLTGPTFSVAPALRRALRSLLYSQA